MIDQNSLASVNAVGVKNVQLKAGSGLLARKIVIIGTYDPGKATVIENTPERVLSPEAVGAKYGFGFQLHRLAKFVFLTSGNTEVWVVPQSEAGGAVESEGTVAFTAPAAIDGNLVLYVGGEKLGTVVVTSGDLAVDIATAVAALVLKIDDAVTIEVDGVNAFENNIISKSKGTMGNDYDISFNVEQADGPVPVALTIAPMAAGATDPNIQDALDALGVGDAQNEENFTALVHGYGVAVLNTLSTWNGAGNDFVGNYKKTTARPLRSFIGDTGPNEQGLTDLIVISDGKKDDRTSGVIPVPGSISHPAEIAAATIGIMEATNGSLAEQNYIDKVLPGIRPGAVDERWTSDYDNRDTAVKSGISTTFVKNGAVVLQDMVTFYRPDSIPANSNGYRSMRNISILQNVIATQKAAFEADKWKGITIVADVTKVGNVASRDKARDADAVLDELLAIVGVFENNAWVYSSSFTIDKLKEGGLVTVRPSGRGFDITLPIVLSGEGGIYNQEIEFDTSLEVFL